LKTKASEGKLHKVKIRAWSNLPKRSGLKVAVKTILTQALWPSTGTKQQHSQTNKTNAPEQQEPVRPLASSASLIAPPDAMNTGSV